MRTWTKAAQIQKLFRVLLLNDDAFLRIFANAIRSEAKRKEKELITTNTGITVTFSPTERIKMFGGFYVIHKGSREKITMITQSKLDQDGLKEIALLYLATNVLSGSCLTVSSTQP